MITLARALLRLNRLVTLRFILNICLCDLPTNRHCVGTDNLGVAPQHKALGEAHTVQAHTAHLPNKAHIFLARL